MPTLVKVGNAHPTIASNYWSFPFFQLRWAMPTLQLLQIIGVFHFSRFVNFLIPGQLFLKLLNFGLLNNIKTA
jgi:hypothetical protein